MSLDVYLTTEARPAMILIQGRGGFSQLMTDDVWEEHFPGTKPKIVEGVESGRIYSANITHNLGAMADEAGIYEALWRPEEIHVTTAAQLIPLLEKGLRKLKDDPARYEKHNPKNGWGTYKGLLEFIDRYLNACREHPDALVTVSR